MMDYQFALEQEMIESEETAEETEDLEDISLVDAWEFWIWKETLEYFEYPLTLPVSTVGTWGISLEIKFWDVMLESQISIPLKVMLDFTGLEASLTTTLDIEVS